MIEVELALKETFLDRLLDQAGIDVASPSDQDSPASFVSTKSHQSPARN